MSEEEKKGYPDGTTKIIHTTLDMLKLKAKIRTAEGKKIGTGVGVKLVYTDPEYGSKTVQLPERKFQDEAAKVPANKNLWTDLQNAVAKDLEDEDVTLEFIKHNGFWDLRSVKEGHVGNAGIFKEGQAQTGGSTSGGYNPAGQIIGKIENWAVHITIANKTAKQKIGVEDVLETLESMDASVIKDINDAATKLYQSAFGGKAPSKPEDTDSDDSEDAESADDSDMDEDIAF